MYDENKDSSELTKSKEKTHLKKFFISRANELKILLDAYNHTQSGMSQLCLISGDSGMGKRKLIEDFQNAIKEKPGLILHGKYVEFQLNTVFSGIIDAFKDYILNSNEKEFLGQKLMNEFQDNSQILLNLIPEFENIIEKQSNFYSLSTLEQNQMRQMRIITQLVHFLCKENPHLTLILENLHAADAFTFECIRQLIANKIDKGPLILATCNQQSLPEVLNKLSFIKQPDEKENIQFEVIKILPLDQRDILDLLIMQFGGTYEESLSFSDLLVQLTKGNLYLLEETLKILYAKDQLKYNEQLGKWHWQLDIIKKLTQNGGSLGLLHNNILLLPKETRDMLFSASIIGSSFSLYVLSVMTGSSPNEVFTLLSPAIHLHLIEPKNPHFPINSYLQEALSGNHLSIEFTKENDLVFEFSRSQNYQLASNLDTKEEKLRLNYKLGAYYLAQYISDKNKLTDPAFFRMLEYLNQSRATLNNLSEKKRLAELNFEGSLKAEGLALNDLAYNLIHVAKNLLPQNKWDEEYLLTRNIYFKTIELSYAKKNLVEVEPLSEELLANLKDKIDKAKLFELKLKYYSTVAYDLAIESGLKAAEIIGFKIPLKPSKLKIICLYLKARYMISKTTIEQVKSIPICQNPEISFLLEIMDQLARPCYWTNRNLLAYTACLGVSIILKEGITDRSSTIFTIFSTIVQIVSKNYKTSWKIACISSIFIERFNDCLLSAKNYFILATNITHWTQPFNKIEEQQNECYKNALNTHDPFYLRYITVFFGIGDGYFYSNLIEAQKRLNSRHYHFYIDVSVPAFHSYTVRNQVIKKLMEPDFRGLSLTDLNFDENKFLETMNFIEAYQPIYQSIFAYKLMISYYFGHYSNCIEIKQKSLPTKEYIKNLATEKEFLFFYTLNLIKFCDNLSFWEKFKKRREIKKNIKWLKIWALACPQTQLHRLRFVEAEYKRLNGKFDSAFVLYDEAIQLANDSNILSESGLINECAANLAFKIGREDAGITYVQAAYKLYSKWGANSKVSHLREKYYKYLLELTSK